MSQTQTPHKTNRLQGGFTLVELVVVMGVMAVLTGIAIPSVLAWMPSMHLKAESTNIRDAFTTARSQAINTGVEHRVLFDNANQTYQIDAGNLMSASTLWQTTLGPYSLEGGVHLSARADLMESETATRNFLRFGSNGSVTSNIDKPYVSTSNDHQSGYFLFVHRRTGHITMKKRGVI